MEKSADAFRTISEVADELKLPQHVLRFWETRFPQVRPMKRGGNRRFYRPDDVELLRAIKTLLYGDGFTIKGVQRILKERGPRAVASLAKAQGRDALSLDPRDFQSPGDEGADDDLRAMKAAFAAGELGETDFASDADTMGEDLVGSGDTSDRLQAILFELSECRRILAAVRD